MENKKPKPELFKKNFQKEWSETHKYKHIHTGEYCTFEAYIAEYLILRKIEAFKEPKPGYKFWTKGDKLYPAFIRQLKAVIKLRKKYSENIILGAIKSEYFNKIFYIGLYAKNYVGWKMNPLAAEAIECYHKEMLEVEKMKSIQIEANNNIITSEEKDIPTLRKTQSYKKSQNKLNNLRNL